ncbi:glycosyltransferase family 2 protein [Micromonospora sp. DT229]|uniref:glycosyltransferase family 2 protein n=1 Tax=Micromonospora sp. DT229 TaxID=3393430 RepID=UPI003CF036B3
MATGGHYAIELSVVIPTHQDAHCLALTLRSLGRQTLSPERFEVVVVRDGGSASGYEDLATDFPGLNLNLVHATEQRGRAAARNEAVRHSRAPLLLFLDADSYTSPQLLERHLAHHAIPGRPPVLLGRRDELHLEHIETALDGKDFLDLPRLRTEGGGDLRFPGGEPVGQDWLRVGWLFSYTHNISVSRSLFDLAGGFKEAFGLRWGLEDVELFYRVHKQLGVNELNFAFDDEARAYHLPHHRRIERDWNDFAANRELIVEQVIEWEFFGMMEVYGSVERILRYRAAIADCVQQSTCRIGPAVQRLAGALPGPRVLWVGTGSAEAGLPAEAITFDYSAPPGPTNYHLVGMNPPIEPGSLDAVVSVDFWRHLRWSDLCQFVNVAGHLAAEVHLLRTDDPATASLPPGVAALDYVRRAFETAFATELTRVDGLGDVLILRPLPAADGPALVEPAGS